MPLNSLAPYSKLLSSFHKKRSRMGKCFFHLSLSLPTSLVSIYISFPEISLYKKFTGRTGYKASFSSSPLPIPQKLFYIHRLQEFRAESPVECWNGSQRRWRRKRIKKWNDATGSQGKCRESFLSSAGLSPLFLLGETWTNTRKL